MNCKYFTKVYMTDSTAKDPFLESATSSVT